VIAAGSLAVLDEPRKLKSLQFYLDKTAELDIPISADVAMIMSDTRSCIEALKFRGKYKTVDLVCDFLLHERLDRAAARHHLANVSKSLWPGIDDERSIQSKFSDCLNIERLLSELSEFYRALNLNDFIVTDPVRSFLFCGLVLNHLDGAKMSMREHVIVDGEFMPERLNGLFGEEPGQFIAEVQVQYQVHPPQKVGHIQNTTGFYIVGTILNPEKLWIDPDKEGVFLRYLILPFDLNKTTAEQELMRPYFMNRLTS